MSEIIAGAGISDIFYMGFIGFMGFMGPITLSNRPWYFSLFTLSEAKSLSQEHIHYLVGIRHGDCFVTIYIGCSHVEVRDA